MTDPLKTGQKASSGVDKTDRITKALIDDVASTTNAMGKALYLVREVYPRTFAKLAQAYGALTNQLNAALIELARLQAADPDMEIRKVADPADPKKTIYQLVSTGGTSRNLVQAIADQLRNVQQEVSRVLNQIMSAKDVLDQLGNQIMQTMQKTGSSVLRMLPNQ